MPDPPRSTSSCATMNHPTHGSWLAMGCAISALCVLITVAVLRLEDVPVDSNYESTTAIALPSAESNQTAATTAPARTSPSAPVHSDPFHEDRSIMIFDRAEISYDPQVPELTRRGDHVLVRESQAVQRTIALPPLPADQAELTRLIAIVRVDPIMTVDAEGAQRPGDPWTRMGSLNLVRDPQLIIDSEENPERNEIELMRFITGYGGSSVFTQDLTSLRPLLGGEITLRTYISTYMNPAWTVSVEFRYQREGIGQRRPIYARPVFNNQSVDATSRRLVAQMKVPAGVSLPRLRIVTTGHATDGAGGDEFTPRTHVVRINDRETARFRPWREDGGDNRAANPMSGRVTIGGRELWSSDLDRAGWLPGRVVEPITIPLPEAPAGDYTVEIEVLGIRPENEDGHMGYWRISAILIADQPWPSE